MTSATSPPSRDSLTYPSLAPPTPLRDEIAFASFWGFVAAAAYAPFAVMPLTQDIAIGPGCVERRFGVIVSARGALPFRPLCYCTLLAASVRLVGEIAADRGAPAETGEDPQQRGLRLQRELAARVVALLRTRPFLVLEDASFVVSDPWFVIGQGFVYGEQGWEASPPCA